MSDLHRSIEIGNIVARHSREEAIAVIRDGHLHSGDIETVLTPEDEFTYRHKIAYGAVKDFSYLERIMLSMYGRSYLDAPELSEFFYHDIETRARNVGQIALFANLHNEHGLPAITIGFLRDTENYPEHIRLSAQSANFNNTLGLSGLTRVKLGAYQRIALDQDGQFDPLHSVLANTLHWNPFIVEHIKLHSDLTTFVERKDMRIGEREIKEWAEAHPGWEQYVEGTLGAVQAGVTNPIIDFAVPENTDGYRNLASFERLLDFERDDEL